MTDLMQLHQFPPMFDDSQEVNQMRFSCNKFQTLIGNSHNQVTTGGAEAPPAPLGETPMKITKDTYIYI